ncbi:hypothetical protein [Cupriavidus pauculus]|uniref:hypothetical protein n=1 Tax=Cupriavidus pauculus TaxID=82633 RepID=UPI0007851284|nr:hypothetical protein [Cupriavidus pauculus]
MNIIQLKASLDVATGQTYVPARDLAADGSLRVTKKIDVPAQGELYSATTFNGEHYGIVDLDCGARVQTLLSPGTDRLGDRVHALEINNQEKVRFSHE